MNVRRSSSGLMITVLVRTETRERLKELGEKGETYDQIINRLIDFWLEHGGQRWIIGRLSGGEQDA